MIGHSVDVIGKYNQLLPDYNRWRYAMPDKPPYPMTKAQRRAWLDNLTSEDRAQLRTANELTREPWDRNRRQSQQIAAFRKQRQFIIDDLRRGATLEVTAQRHDLDYGLLVALLIDDGLLVLRAGNETVNVRR